MYLPSNESGPTYPQKISSRPSWKIISPTHGPNQSHLGLEAHTWALKPCQPWPVRGAGQLCCPFILGSTGWGLPVQVMTAVLGLLLPYH